MELHTKHLTCYKKVSLLFVLLTCGSFVSSISSTNCTVIHLVQIKFPNLLDIHIKFDNRDEILQQKLIIFIKSQIRELYYVVLTKRNYNVRLSSEYEFTFSV